MNSTNAAKIKYVYGRFIFRYKIGLDISRPIESAGITNKIRVFVNECTKVCFLHIICISMEKKKKNRLAIKDILENTRLSITFSLAW